MQVLLELYRYGWVNKYRVNLADARGQPLQFGARKRLSRLSQYCPLSGNPRFRLIPSVFPRILDFS